MVSCLPSRPFQDAGLSPENSGVAREGRLHRELPIELPWDTTSPAAQPWRGIDLRLESETAGDGWEIEALLDTAFGPGRQGLSSYRLREGVDPVAGLSLVARDEFETIAGTIRFWPVRVGKEGHGALLLGPVAVHPIRQGEGIGAALIAEGLDRAWRSGWEAVILIGDVGYYSRFGFERHPGLLFPQPTDQDRVLSLDMSGPGAGSLAGQVRKWNEKREAG